MPKKINNTLIQTHQKTYRVFACDVTPPTHAGFSHAGGQELTSAAVGAAAAADGVHSNKEIKL